MNTDNTMQVTNERGLKFNVRLVFAGEGYGLRNVLTHEGDDPLVEFYDMRYPHTEFGQFVSRYYASTLLEPRQHVGLCLDGGVLDWAISADNYVEVVEFLRPRVPADLVERKAAIWAGYMKNMFPNTASASPG